MHEVDEIGYPIDPEPRRLEFHLGDLAAAWRGSIGHSERQTQIVHDYHSTMEQLYTLGWSSILDIESELLESLMPSEYLKCHPRVGKWK